MTGLTFFDVDNTLIQSSSGHVAAMLAAVREIYGLEVSIEVIHHHGMTDPEIIAEILRKYEIADETIQSKLRDCVECMPLKYAEIVKSENIVMMEGVGELLTRLLHSGFIPGLVTGNLEKIAWAKLKKIGIDHFFKIGGFGSDHVNRAELIKIAVNRARDKLNLGGQLQVFHFGDAPQDMKAGREAGVAPIGVATGIFSAEQLTSAGAEIVLPNLKDTDGILQFLMAFR